MLCPWIVLQDTCLFLSSNVICMMCTPYTYNACVKCLAGDGVTMFTLQLLAACLDQS